MNRKRRLIIRPQKVSSTRCNRTPINRFLHGPIRDRVTLNTRRRLAFTIRYLMSNLCWDNNLSHSQEAIRRRSIFNAGRFISHYFLNNIRPKRPCKLRAGPFKLNYSIGSIPRFNRPSLSNIRRTIGYFRRRPMNNLIRVGLSTCPFTFPRTIRYILIKRYRRRRVAICMARHSYGSRMVRRTTIPLSSTKDILYRRTRLFPQFGNIFLLNLFHALRFSSRLIR